LIAAKIKEPTEAWMAARQGESVLVRPNAQPACRFQRDKCR
jgi:hypothetical protein